MMKKTLTTILSVAILILWGGTLCFASEADGDKYMDTKEYRKAIKEYEAALKNDAKNEKLYIKLAQAYEKAVWHGRAVQYWEDYLTKFPKGEDAAEAKKGAARSHRWLSGYYYNNGAGLDKVLQELNAAVKWDPALFEAQYWLGRVYGEMGNFPAAIRALQAAVTLKPDNKAAAWLLKDTQGRLDSGNVAYRHYSAAYPLYEKKDLEGALKQYRLAAQANPDFAGAHFWIARILLEQNKYADALAEWQKVLSLEPGNKRAAWFRDETKRKLGK